MRARRIIGIVAISLGVLGAGIVAPSAGAIDQTFGTNQSGHAIIGSYYRDGTTAAVPYANYLAGGGTVSYAQFSNSGNIARLAVGFTTSPCARALGTATGFTWGDAYCSAV